MEPLASGPFCSHLMTSSPGVNFAFGRRDRLPGQRGHLFVIPFRHAADYFSLTGGEKHAVPALVDVCRGVIEGEFSPAGYNIGFNVGAARGADLVMPLLRESAGMVGDGPGARGGIRGVVPGKRGY